MKYDYRGLEKLFEWVADQGDQDSDCEELHAGVIVVSGQGELPRTSSQMLEFLSGANAAHPPVIPGVTVVEYDENTDMKLCPWKDIASLIVTEGALTGLWPPEERRKNCSWGQGLHPPSAQEATRALVCAAENATEEELHILAKQCTFFGCMGRHGALKPTPALTGYFKRFNPTPYVIVCANHSKRTISFSYQVSFWME